MSKNTEFLPSIHRQNITVWFYLYKYPCCHHIAAVYLYATCTLCQLRELWMIHLSNQMNNNVEVGRASTQKQSLLVLRIAQDEVFLPVRILFFSFQYCLKCKTQPSVSKAVHSADANDCRSTQTVRLPPAGRAERSRTYLFVRGYHSYTLHVHSGRVSETAMHPSWNTITNA